MKAKMMIQKINDVFQIIDDDLCMLENRPQAIWACETAEDMHQELCILEVQIKTIRQEIKEMKSELIEEFKNYN